VPTREGLLWLKDNPAGNAFEPALTALLAEIRPDALPEVVAHDGPRLLTRHVGPRFRDLLDTGTPAPAWEEVLALYGEVQVGVMPLAEQALALGAADERPALLPELYEDLVGRDAWHDRIAEAAASLGESVPLSVVHQEAHDGNVFVRNGRAVFIDWAESSVTHPFLGPLLPLRSATERAGYEPGSREVDGCAMRISSRSPASLPQPNCARPSHTRTCLPRSGVPSSGSGSSSPSRMR
jgi:hypothetical protein